MGSKLEELDLKRKGKQFVCLEEKNLEEQMRTVVEPMLLQTKKQGQLAVKGGELYYELYSQKQTADTIVICHGFSESAEKYGEFIYYLYNAGYQVAIWDQRGHGRSLREGIDPNVVHIEEFSDYVEDMHHFVEQVVKPFAEGGRLYLYAHSMGGCVGALYLEQYPEDFEKAVLNAPMLAIQMGACPLWVAKGICDVEKLIGKGKKRLFTQGEFNPEEPFAESCSDSEARHLYYHAKRRENSCFQTSSASYAWGSTAIRAGRRAVRKKNASRIKIPVLLFQAGRDNQVKAKAQEEFIKYVEKGRIIRISQAKHEIYRAQNVLLAPYMEEILQFF
ncbi:MAG: alpha/beta fold hydrolase [Lachnospiraceae bacterium]